MTDRSAKSRVEATTLEMIAEESAARAEASDLEALLKKRTATRDKKTADGDKRKAVKKRREADGDDVELNAFKTTVDQKYSKVSLTPMAQY